MAAPGTSQPPRPRATPLQTLTYEGLPLGMITKVPKYDIPDGGAAYIQDALLDIPETTRQRGPFKAITGMPAFSSAIFGAVSCYDPANTLQIGVVDLTSGGSFWRMNAALTSKTAIVSDGPLNILQTSPWTVFQSSQSVTSGVLFGMSRYYETSSLQAQALIYWRGASTRYTTGTITTAHNSTAVTGVGTSWLGNVDPGSFLLDSSGNYVGVVSAVTSNTAITLEEPALLAIAGAAYLLVPTRGIFPTVTVGEITCGTAAATVTGSNTKFKKQGLDTGTWDLFRQRDKTYIGTVTSVTNDTSLTLTANAAINCNVDNYVAVKRAGPLWGGNLHGIGWLTAAYARRQFYANQDTDSGVGPVGKVNYLWFSEQELFESVDLSAEDGDFIKVTSGTAHSDKTPIKALAPGNRSLVILKEDETFVLTGAEKEQFQVDKVYDDGVLSGTSIQTWRDNVIWAGKQGIYAWDGTQVNDLTKNTLGPEYRYALSGFDPTAHRMWAAIDRDHYILTIETVTPRISVTKGTTTTTPTTWTIVINLATGALNLWTNLTLRGSLQLPASYSPSTWLIAYDSVGAHGVILDGDAIFDSTGSDTLNSTTSLSGVNQLSPGLLFQGTGTTSVPAGPNFFVESKRYPLGDPVRRKLIKQLAMYYMVLGTDLTIDSIVGPGDTTKATNTVTFLDTTTALDQWGKKRYKFLAHDNFIGFRFYPAGNPTSLKLGPFQIGFKTQAAGRI